MPKAKSNIPAAGIAESQWINKLNNKTLFLIWLTCVLIYLAGVWGMDIPFDIFNISLLTNLCVLPVIFRKSAPLKVENPIDYVRFCEEYLYVGDLKVPISNIRKVALDSVGEYGYFSLPYNHIAPAGVPNFMFPAHSVSPFKQYLIDNLNDIKFIS